MSENTKLLSNKISIYLRATLALFIATYFICTEEFESFCHTGTQVEYMKVGIPALTLLLYFTALIGHRFSKYDFYFLIFCLMLMTSVISLPTYVYLIFITVGLIMLLLTQFLRTKTSLRNIKHNNHTE